MTMERISGISVYPVVDLGECDDVLMDSNACQENERITDATQEAFFDEETKFPGRMDCQGWNMI